MSDSAPPSEFPTLFVGDYTKGARTALALFSVLGFSAGISFHLSVGPKGFWVGHMTLLFFLAGLVWSLVGEKKIAWRWWPLLTWLAASLVAIAAPTVLCWKTPSWIVGQNGWGSMLVAAAIIAGTELALYRNRRLVQLPFEESFELLVEHFKIRLATGSILYFSLLTIIYVVSMF